MKIVGVVGSPRVGGNVEALTRVCLDEISKEGIETELISLAGKKIAPCDACASCRETGKCHVEDDFDAVFAKLVEADGVVLGTPVYFGAASPQMVCFISRFYAHGSERILENKVGGPIVVARRAGQNFAFAQLLLFCFIQGMIVPGSTYWNVAFGRHKGEALKDEEGVNTVKSFGQKLAWLVKKIKA